MSRPCHRIDRKAMAWPTPALGFADQTKAQA